MLRFIPMMAALALVATTAAAQTDAPVPTEDKLTPPAAPQPAPTPAPSPSPASTAEPQAGDPAALSDAPPK